MCPALLVLFAYIVWKAPGETVVEAVKNRPSGDLYGPLTPAQYDSKMTFDEIIRRVKEIAKVLELLGPIGASFGLWYLRKRILKEDT